MLHSLTGHLSSISDCNGTRTQNHLVRKRTLTLDFAPVSSKEFLDIQATIKNALTLKRVLDMITIYSHLSSCCVIR